MTNNELLKEFQAYLAYCEVQRQMYQKEIDRLESDRDRVLQEARTKYEAFLREYMGDVATDDNPTP